jgi:hypothetical protein
MPYGAVQGGYSGFNFGRLATSTSRRDRGGRFLPLT